MNKCCKSSVFTILREHKEETDKEKSIKEVKFEGGRMISLPLFIYRFTSIGFFVHQLPLLSRTSQTPRWSQVCLSSA